MISSCMLGNYSKTAHVIAVFPESMVPIMSRARVTVLGCFKQGKRRDFTGIRVTVDSIRSRLLCNRLAMNFRMSSTKPYFGSRGVFFTAF